MEFKAYQLVYYKGKLSETISQPTPENTIMLRTTPNDPGIMIEVPDSIEKQKTKAFLLP